MTKKPLLFLPGGGFGDMICSLPILEYVLNNFCAPLGLDLVVGDTKNSELYKTFLKPETLAKIKAIEPGIGPEFIKGEYTDRDEYAAALKAHNEFLVENYSSVMACNELVTMSLFGLNKEILGGLFDTFVQPWFDRLQLLEYSEKGFPNTNHMVAQFATKLGLNRVTLPQWLLGMPEPYQYPDLTHVTADVKKFKLPRRFITFNDSWNAVEGKERPTKAYKPELWKQFVELCRAKDLLTVQIGSNANGEDHGADFNLRGQTTMAECLQILKLSRVHVDIEGGLSHAATALKTPVVCLVGPTNPSFFTYPRNTNLKTGNCQGCWWLTGDWMYRCLAAQNASTFASCMSHSPRAILDAVLKVY